MKTVGLALRGGLGLLCLTLSLLLSNTVSGHELFVLHPHQLARKFNFNSVTNKGLIQSSLGGFGTFEKDGVFQGRVHYPFTNQDGCNPFNETDFEQNHLKEASFDGHRNVIMVDRGNCHFVKKVKNIQKFGAVMAIIVDQNDVEATSMKDDGKGGSISIPSFLIGKRDGTAIKEAIHDMRLPDIEILAREREERMREQFGFDPWNGAYNHHLNRDIANN